MGLPRRNKHDKENVHAARPWDNAHTGVKALCAAFEDRPRDDSRKALHDFIEEPSPNIRTRIGNREVKPLVNAPKPLPLVGLPVPGKNHVVKSPLKPVQPGARSRSPTVSQRMIGMPVEMELHEEEDCLPGKLPEPATPDMVMEDPELMPRFSYRKSVRQSVRIPSGSINDSTKASSRASRRVDPEHLSFLPKSSSFLDFNDDERLEPLEPEKEKGVWKGMTFDEADTFDTFESVDSSEEKEEQEEQEVQEQEEVLEIEPKATAARPESDESEKPLFPAMSFSRKSGGAPLPVRRRVDEEEDGGLDVPKRMTRRPGAEGALRDLQRASITAGREIQQSLRLMAQGEQAQKKTRESKVQGDLFLRSRIFRRWNLRYASIVQQGYFGAVLLLFRPEGRGVASGLALKSSKMIALAESTVRVVEGKRLDLFMFELKTSQRTYAFACSDEEGRDYWMKHLGAHQ